MKCRAHLGAEGSGGAEPFAQQALYLSCRDDSHIVSLMCTEVRQDLESVSCPGRRGP